MYNEEISRTDDETLRGYLDPIWSGRTVYRILVTSEKLAMIRPGHRVLETPHMVGLAYSLSLSIYEMI